MRKQPHQQHHQHRYEDDAMMTTTSSSSSSSSLRSASPTSSSTTWTSSRRTKPLNNVAKFIAAIALALLACLPIVVLADEHSHEYESNDAVTIWLNKIGPYHNPQETYPYYFLPFCAPKQKTALQANDDSLSVMLEGDEVTDSGLVLRFRENVDMQEVCTQKIDEEAQTSFEDAIHSHFWYQMYIDELPVWGMVGEVMESDVTDADGQSVAEEMPFIYTHKDFSISYNGAHIIEVNLTSENPRPVVAGTEYPMTYSVRWQAVDTPFESRFDRYLDFDFFEHQIHWFSIFNSFMMVMFLCGLVAFILMRTLKNDYARYAVEDDDIELDRVVDESGWKQVHGDVFRAPPMLALFSALLGSGAQLASLTFALIVIALVGTMYDQRGSLSSAVLVVYCLTSVVSGYVSASTYKRYGGSGWKRTMLLTASLYPSLCFSLGLALNTLALVHGSTTLFTVNVIFGLFGIFLFISCPLVLLGTIMGRLAVTPGEFPCRINNLRRPIPDGKWYTRPWFLALCSGILPFGSIFIEMYFIFTSFWNYKFYYVYGFMFLVFTILFLVTVCVTIVSTYVLLNSEDYRWHWTSFGSGASTGIYMFLYAVFYFFQKTRMSGILQTCYYFGYMAAFSVGFAIMCGGISFLGAHLFVWRVYQIIKID